MGQDARADPSRALEPLIVDASALYMLVDSMAPRRDALEHALTRWHRLVVPAFVAAEADYLILERWGVDPQLAFLDDLAEHYEIESLDRAGLRQARAVCAQYRDLELGLADASMVVLAARLKTRSIATFDHRHFRAVTPLQGGSFTLIPDDL